ncbi:restriction endonuclease [Streptomyces sp. NPDC005899]|uniref:restriction endonuclease n=1 Tax=Streptomyces sp. NPDC005899 TaxID=3155716 RepID=UPI0033F791DF
MSRRSNGLVGAWAESQRQLQRQHEAQHRAAAQAAREQERARRAHERDMARLHREQQAEYRRRREADARQRTEELDARVGMLEGLLAAGSRVPAFRTASLARAEDVEPFAPGQLALPVRMPDVNRYQAQGGWTAGRRAQAQQEAQARYQQDWQAAQAAEVQRQQQLALYRRQYNDWAEGQLGEIRRHNAGVAEMAVALRQGDVDAVVQYFSAALYASSAWPADFPRQVTAAFDPAGRQLVLDWELPGLAVVPESKAVRYLVGTDQEKETPRPAGQRRALYRDVLAQSMLLVLRDVFAADEFRVVESVALNGFTDDVDPVTGRPSAVFLSTVMVSRAEFAELNLQQVSAVDCLVEGLRGQLSTRPDQRVAVRPGRVPGDLGSGAVSHGGGGDPDLLEMDPIAFEGLVAELFRARGMRAVTTQRSNDGGVDVEALDPDPISGGKIIVQVKRYRNTVPPSAVRDLYGTVQGAGANKGVLVTTSGFGPGSYTFANGKPLTLVSGTELVDLLGRCGLRGRLSTGEGGAVVPAQRLSPVGEQEPGGDHNVLGMTWSGDVKLDVCALVCRGGRVLSDDHFVFFNNPRTPEGAVRAVPGFAGDRAAVRVAFDALPAAADRVVLVAAVDPEADPGGDLAGFTDAGIRLRDAAGVELERLEVSDGRAGEVALVLGSFRLRGCGDWEFVAGGKGYPGGLGALVQEYGIEVA